MNETASHRAQASAVATRPGRLADRVIIGSEARPASLDVAKAVLLAEQVSPTPSEAREALRVLVAELAYQWDVPPCVARGWAEAVLASAAAPAHHNDSP
jgi:hypothetical protein